MRKMEGSLTIEAALILPLVLFLFLTVTKAGIMLYMEYQDTVVSVMEEKEWDTIRNFYIWNKSGDITGDEN